MLRRSILLLALLASAGAAQAGDRYGPGGSNDQASQQAYGAAAPANGRLLTWNAKAPPPAPQAADGQGRLRPAPVSDWARRAEAERTSRMNTPVQGQVVPQSVYTQPQGQITPQSIYTQAAAAPAALPASIYAPAPPKPYQASPRPAGAPIEVKPQDLPDQPTLAQQMAADEAASVMEAKIARARALEAKGGAASALVQSQDAVR